MSVGTGMGAALVVSAPEFQNGSFSLTKQEDCNIFFGALLPVSAIRDTAATGGDSEMATEPHPASSSGSISPGGVLGLLTGAAEYFNSLSLSKSKEQKGHTISSDTWYMYLKSVSHHVEILLEALRHENERYHVTKVIIAVGLIVTKCGNQNDISRSGIISALYYLATNSTLSTTILNDQTISAQSNPNDETQTVSTSLTPPSSFQFTPIHTELLQACVSCGHFYFACEFADRYPIHSVMNNNIAIQQSTVGGDVQSSSLFEYMMPFNVDHFLRYFYLLGISRLALNQYKLAKNAFEKCITTPSQKVSSITMSARKKLLFVQCLLMLQQEYDDHEDEAGLNASFGDNKECYYTEDGKSSSIRDRNNAYASVSISESDSNPTNNMFRQITNKFGKEQFITVDAGMRGQVLSVHKKLTLYDQICSLPKGTYPEVQQFFEDAFKQRHFHPDDVEEQEQSMQSGYDDVSEYQQPASATSIIAAAANAIADPYRKKSKTEHKGNISRNKIKKSSNSREIVQYYDLILSFVTYDTNISNSNYTELKREMENLLKTDDNWELATLLEEKLLTKKLRKLQEIAKVYSVIPLQKLAKKLDLSCAQDAENLVLRVVSDQFLDTNSSSSKNTSSDIFTAEIDEEDGVVYFGSSYSLKESKENSNDELQKELVNRMQKCVDLSHRIEELDVKLASSNKYQSSLVTRDARRPPVSSLGGLKKSSFRLGF